MKTMSVLGLQLLLFEFFMLIQVIVVFSIYEIVWKKWKDSRNDKYYKS